jgi:hypothetical protein
MLKRSLFPREVGVIIPGRLVLERYQQGFQHALGGGQITAVEHLKLSFREGFRAGKLYCRRLRQARGIMDFPMRARVRFASSPRF